MLLQQLGKKTNNNKNTPHNLNSINTRSPHISKLGRCYGWSQTPAFTHSSSMGSNSFQYPGCMVNPAYRASPSSNHLRVGDGMQWALRKTQPTQWRKSHACTHHIQSCQSTETLVTSDMTSRRAGTFTNMISFGLLVHPGKRYTFAPFLQMRKQENIRIFHHHTNRKENTTMQTPRLQVPGQGQGPFCYSMPFICPLIHSFIRPSFHSFIHSPFFPLNCYSS